MRELKQLRFCGFSLTSVLVGCLYPYLNPPPHFYYWKVFYDNIGTPFDPDQVFKDLVVFKIQSFIIPYSLGEKLTTY